MLLSSSSEFKGEKGVPPLSLVISVGWLVTHSPLNPALVDLARRSYYQKNALCCIAAATMVIKIALIVWIIFWTEPSDAKPLLLNAPEPFAWQLGTCWG